MEIKITLLVKNASKSNIPRTESSESPLKQLLQIPQRSVVNKNIRRSPFQVLYTLRHKGLNVQPALSSCNAVI